MSITDTMEFVSQFDPDIGGLMVQSSTANRTGWS